MKNICRNLEDFEDLTYESKQACESIYYNEKKQDKRRDLISGFDDVFDNEVKVVYFFKGGSLHVFIGNPKK